MTAISTAPLRSERLLLRSFVAGDVPELVELVGDRRIADTMISVPHPYLPEYALAWIEKCARNAVHGRAVAFALVAHGEGQLRGAIELREIDHEHEQAELSFWIGCSWWGQGYATEAAAKMLELAFGRLDLNRVYAFQMQRNPACATVLGRIGMRREGVLRQRVKKWGVYENVGLWAILRSDTAYRLAPGGS